LRSYSKIPPQGGEAFLEVLELAADRRDELRDVGGHAGSLKRGKKRAG
jgi:hypothetical protein